MASDKTQSKQPGAPAQSSTTDSTTDLSDQVKVCFDKLDRLRGEGKNPYRNDFSPDALAEDLHQAYDEKSKEELDTLAKTVSVAGRMMLVRDFGKASFVRLQDRTGIIQ